MKWNQLPYDSPVYDPNVDTLTRQSDIGQMQLCPGRVGFREHPKYLQMVSEPLVFGTMVHHLIEQHVTQNEQQDKLLQSMDEWVEEILVREYDWNLSKVTDVRSFFSEIAVAYSNWVRIVRPTLRLEDALAVEQEYRMYLGAGTSGNVFLKGTADLVMPQALVDWKTSGRAWKQAKADFSVQASLYMPLHKANDIVTTQTFIFWVYNRQTSSWDQMPTNRTVAQINSALATALQYGRQLESKSYPCTPVPEAAFNKARGWYCKPKWCNAWNACDAKFMNDGVDEKEEAVRAW